MDVIDAFLIGLALWCLASIGLAALKRWSLWAVWMGAYLVGVSVAVVRLSDPDPLGFAILAILALVALAFGLIGGGICWAIHNAKGRGIVETQEI